MAVLDAESAIIRYNDSEMKTVKYLIGENKIPFYGYIHENMEDVGGLYSKRPAVIVCPGGGYIRLSIREEDPAVFPLFSHGYNVFVLKYSVGDEILHSFPEEEAALAISTLKRGAEKLDIEADHIAILGFSAGGHVAASIACHWKKYGEEARPDAAVLCYPVITMGEHGHQGSTDTLTHGDERLKSYYSLETQTDEDTAPCFIWHTFPDQAVDVWNSLSFASALHRSGVETELHIYSEGPHGASLGYRETGEEVKAVQSWMDLLFGWLDRRWGFLK